MIDEKFILMNIKILLPVYDMLNDFILIAATTEHYAFNLLVFVEDSEHILIINIHSVVPEIGREKPKTFKISGWDYISNIDVTGTNSPFS